MKFEGINYFIICGWARKLSYGFKNRFRGWKFGIFGLFFVMADQFIKEFKVKKSIAETWHTLSLDEKNIGKKIS